MTWTAEALRERGRILYATSVDLSRPDGPGVNEREFVLELQRAFGARAHCLLPPPRGPVPELDRSTCTFVFPLRLDPVGFLRHQWDLYRKGRALLAGGGYDLCVLRLTLMPLGLRSLMRWARVPYAVKTLGGPLFDGFVRGVDWKELGKAVVSPLHERARADLARGALAVDACTTELRTRVVHMGVPAERVEVVENATNVDRFRLANTTAARRALGLERFSRIVGFVGGQPLERGGRELIELVAGLRDAVPGLGVVIVGGPGAETLRALAGERGVADRCVVTGVVPYDDVPGYVQAFDIGIAVDMGRRNAVVGNSYQKVRQYLACGRVVLTLPGGQIDVEGLGFGSVVPPGDAGALRAAVVRWLAEDEPAARERAARAAAWVAEHLSSRRALTARLAHWAARLNAETRVA